VELSVCTVSVGMYSFCMKSEVCSFGAEVVTCGFGADTVVQFQCKCIDRSFIFSSCLLRYTG
jgi:hypothetical protein